MRKIILTLTLLCSTQLFAEDLKAILDRTVQLNTEGKHSKALKELDWAKQEIMKGYTAKLNTFFPDEIEGFKATAAVENSGALGFTNAERNYKNGNVSVKLSLTGGSGGAAAGGLAGLAQLGQMAAMFGGQQPGQEMTRIQGRTVQVEGKKDSVEATLFLESGSILKAEVSHSADAEVAKKVLTAMKLDDLDSYIKG